MRVTKAWRTTSAAEKRATARLGVKEARPNRQEGQGGQDGQRLLRRQLWQRG